MTARPIVSKASKRPPRPPEPRPPAALRNKDAFGTAIVARVSIEGTAQIEIWNFDHTAEMARDLLAWLPKGILFLDRLARLDEEQRERRVKADAKKAAE